MDPKQQLKLTSLAKKLFLVTADVALVLRVEESAFPNSASTKRLAAAVKNLDRARMAIDAAAKSKPR
jgi:hypothetical protein